MFNPAVVVPGGPFEIGNCGCGNRAQFAQGFGRVGPHQRIGMSQGPNQSRDRLVRPRPHLAERFGGQRTDPVVRIPQCTDQSRDRDVGRGLANFPERFDRLGPDPVVVVLGGRDQGRGRCVRRHRLHAADAAVDQHDAGGADPTAVLNRAPGR